MITVAQNVVSTLRGVHLEKGCEAEALGDGLNGLYVLFDDTTDITLHAEMEKRLRAVKRLRGIGDGVGVERALYVRRTAQGITAEVQLWLWDDRFTDEDSEACRFGYDMAAHDLTELARYYAAAYAQEILNRFGRV